LSEPAFYEPCVALHARLEAAQFGAERLAGDGAVADREILRRPAGAAALNPVQASRLAAWAAERQYGH
jgi:hypothetical protein